MTTYVNVIKPGEGFMVYGAAAQLWACRDSECVISGPAETGKTIGALHKLHLMAQKYPKAHLALVRKTRKSMDASVIKSYLDKVVEPNFPLEVYGGSKPDWFDYPNGSRIVVGGMDNPDKMLSSEYDAVYVNQAEELTVDDWEKLLTRTTGRAGNIPYAQVLGDANPGPRTHWILERANEGKLTLLYSKHEDNPTLFNPDSGVITKQGKRTLAVLDSLTGVRYQRLRLGKWVSAEGQVYEGWDPAAHLIDSFPIPWHWRRIRVIDFGLVHPFVCAWIAIDHDGRMYVYRQIYMTGRTVATHARQIVELTGNEAIEATICDHDAEDRLTLQENGIVNLAAKKDVLQGIGKVQDRLIEQIDGKARLYIFRDSLAEVDQSLKMAHKPYAIEQEFDGYIWMDNVKKEQPVKDSDHGLDCIRYGVFYVDGHGPGKPLPVDNDTDSRWTKSVQQPTTPDTSRWTTELSGGRGSRWRR